AADGPISRQARVIRVARRMVVPFFFPPLSPASGERGERPGGHFSALNSPRSLVLLASMVISLPCRPATQPPPSCSTTRRNLPAGAFLISKLPSLSVTAKYGCGKTKTRAPIHPWMSHLTRFGMWYGWNLLASMVTDPPVGSRMFLLALGLALLPMMLVLWE